MKFDGFTTRIVRNSGLPRDSQIRYIRGVDRTAGIPMELECHRRAEESILIRVGCDWTYRFPGIRGSSMAGVCQLRRNSIHAVVPCSCKLRSQRRARDLYQRPGGWTYPIAGHLAPGKLNSDTGQPTDGLFQIGRNIKEIPAASSRKIPASYSFDGIIDELKIYDRTA